MSNKGVFNVAFFAVEYLFDVLWVLARTVLSPLFIIGWLLTPDKPIGEYDWWPN